MRLTPAGAARRVASASRALAVFLDRLGRSESIQINHFMGSWDMIAEPDEAFYLAQYWHWLERVLPRLPAEARILDIGCGQGRLTLPLAEALPQATVVGVDLSEQAIDAARGYAAARGFENVEFRTADAVESFSTVSDSSVDLVLFVEVTQWMGDRYQEALAEIARVLKPGGMLFATFRSQYYQLLKEVQEGRFEAAATVRDSRSAHLAGDALANSWHTPEDVRTLLFGLGFDLDGPYGIGVVTGHRADPLRAIAQPSKIGKERWPQLLDLEVSLAERYAGCARFMVAVATSTKRAPHDLDF